MPVSKLRIQYTMHFAMHYAKYACSVESRNLSWGPLKGNHYGSITVSVGVGVDVCPFYGNNSKTKRRVKPKLAGRLPV